MLSRFVSPSEIDRVQVQALYEEGMLRLVLPKRKAVENCRKLSSN